MLTSSLKANILVVDDTPENLRLLTTLLKEQGYEARPVPSGKLALRAATSDPPDLILLDVNMPGMNGYEVCERLKALQPTRDIPVIFISALHETVDKVRAFGAGGVDYITKPFEFAEVEARLRTHLALRLAQLEIERHNEQLQGLVQEQVRDIISAQKRMSAAQHQTIVAMSKIAEARDDDTGKHIERTQTYCRLLAEHLATKPAFAGIVDAEFCDNIFHASPLHDIGKVAIPDAILQKPGRLTKEEFEVMKEHAVLGARTLMAVREMHPDNSFVEMGIHIAHHHHEKWDGSGYPDGLAGTDIPLAARIMAVADAYDAMRSRRVYKEPFTHRRTADIIEAETGSHFAPDVGAAFLEIQDAFDAVDRELNRA